MEPQSTDSVYSRHLMQKKQRDELVSVIHNSSSQQQEAADVRELTVDKR